MLPEVDIGSDDLCQVMYTSGTTGKQKGVMHSHASVYAGVMSNVAEFNATRADVASGLFPLFHVTQHCIALTFWSIGGAIDLRRGFAPLQARADRAALSRPCSSLTIS